MKITAEMSQGAYIIAKKLYFKEITRSESKSLIAEKTGMSEGSAQAFVTIFLAMMDGREYKRAFNNYTNKLLLESIHRDFGVKMLQKALEAVQSHINYYATLGKGNLTELQEIVNDMKRICS